MTIRQRFLKLFYPLLMKWTRSRGGRKMIENRISNAPVSFYTLRDTLINGQAFDFSSLKGKKVLLVNTASDCGYTDQYDELQKLYQKHADTLVVIGFPANDFKQQEKGNDEQIASFCRINYGVTFPLMKKSVVVDHPAQNPVFRWLTNPAENGWNSKFPSWNFSKYLVNEQGMLSNYFEPSVSPLSKEVLSAINQK